MKKYLCCYHANCQDGFSSAYVVWRFFNESQRLDEIDFVPCMYGDPVPNIDDRVVFIVDFSFPPAVLFEAAKKAHKVVILDHHESAIKKWHVDGLDIDSRFEVYFSEDNSKSGVGMTWDYFYRNATKEEMPAMLHNSQDYDLWKKPPNCAKYTREIITYVYSTEIIAKQQFARFHELVETYPVDKMVANGEVILEYQKVLLAQVFTIGARKVDFDGIKAIMVTVPYALTSLAGSLLYDKHQDVEFAVMYEDNHLRGVRKVSLRSRDGGESVNIIAERFGGGGHKHAAGFEIPLKDIPEDWYSGKYFKKE